MPRFSSFTKSLCATRKRLFLLVVVFILQSTLSPLHAARPGEFGQGVPAVDPDTQAEALTRMELFRNQRLNGAYVFDFVLKDMPRRGDTRLFYGTLWGHWKNALPLFRLRLQYPEGSENYLDLIVNSGPHPKAWIAFNGAPPAQMKENQLFLPIVPELDYSVFDLAMAFVYWNKFDYMGAERIRGQPAHVFIMYPPQNLPADISHVRVILHARYNSLIEAETFNKAGEPVKSLRMRSFKEIQDQWIVSTIDVTNEVSKNKSRFNVMRAALDIALPENYFSPVWSDGYILPRADKWEVVNQ